MSVTIDITGLPTDRITVAISPLGELGMALHALAEPAHHPALQGWATAVSARLEPGLADRLCEVDFLWRATISDVFLPFAALPGQSLPGATLAEELDLLDKLTDQQFVDAALEVSCGVSYGRLAPHILADAAARDRALELVSARGPRRACFAQRLIEDPPRIRAWFRRLMEDCEEAFFADTWARLRHQLAADARHKAELLRHKGLGPALAATSTAVSLDEEAGRISVDKLTVGHARAAESGLALVPTSLGGPHLLVLHRHGWRPVLHYPLAASGMAALSSVDLLSRRMAALAHPVRMRLCRYLARGPYTTGELADAHGLTPPEVSRHLASLRKAGLLTTQRRGRYVQYQLDLGVVARLGGEFIEGVLR
ncbi:putative transcriptional regulator [Streptomyces albus]|uniref:Putative transcriptional regulator n=1 Tax=Streptomyces albus (strain ATCC 21838 / DSM 41398 / FERM P-419 / JCM 4703 / NBRC 107858) TaxID=1081613 RepID=A0A0B5ENT2_STRA4|nr:putative transcriptional regulator [Streptomyces albus]AOU77578.1 putative transcriptional regulator [Streptomyces albus]AYN33346.1 ArsR family transcriptional regulator [Streptomyces albus]